METLGRRTSQPTTSIPILPRPLIRRASSTRVRTRGNTRIRQRIVLLASGSALPERRTVGHNPRRHRMFSGRLPALTRQIGIKTPVTLDNFAIGTVTGGRTKLIDHPYPSWIQLRHSSQLPLRLGCSSSMIPAHQRHRFQCLKCNRENRRPRWPRSITNHLSTDNGGPG